MSTLRDLARLGQSVWFDYIQKSIISEGRLKELILEGVKGVTSNPAIFEKAIAKSDDYDDSIREMTQAGLSPEVVCEQLSLQDVGAAADLFLPVHKSSRAVDGYVSVEVDPRLAYRTEATIAEGKRIFSALDRPNIMIKVPATREGLPAIRELIGEGVNVNATLMFSEQHYRNVSGAYLEGLQTLRKRGGDLSRVASVASVFVSRVDTLVDQKLESYGHQDLKGRIAIANAKNIYRIFLEVFAGEKWEALARSGARVQRVLWASTGTKNPDYPDTFYVDELIGRNTVNTLPPATLQAFIDHGRVEETVNRGFEEAGRLLRELGELGISLEALTEQLQIEGVKAFIEAYENLLSSVEEKQKHLAASNRK